MKILVVTNMYPTEKDPFYGIFVKEHVEALKKQGVMVDVVFIYGKRNRLNYFLSLVPILKSFLSNRYDVINIHHTYCVFPVVIVKTLLSSKSPLLLSFHEGEVHFSNTMKFAGTDLIKSLVFSKKLKILALNLVDLVVAVQDDLLKALNFVGRHEILPCGVDTDLFKPLDKKMSRAKLNLPLNKKIVFFPASPKDSQKGIDILSQALASIDRKDIYLLTGGNIHHDDMPYYMCAADVVVQLSIFEASPMVLKEALACNMPVVFTDAGDAKRTVGDAEGFFLCKRNPQDVALKLENALNFDGKSNGRDRIFNVGLSLTATSKKFIDICESLLNYEGNA